MKIYTKSGDQGETGLFHGPRVPKDDARIEAYGTVDELSAAIGLARCADISESLDTILERIQHQLFSLGAELATPDPARNGTPRIGSQEIDWVEATIDQLDSQLAPLTNFILPFGTAGAASLHYARVVCRRAERRVVTLSRSEELSGQALAYLNRVGDLLFVLARHANYLAGREDVLWQRDDSPEN